VLFIGGLEQRTVPRQMWSGIREEISPAILAVATFLFALALLFMAAVEWLRARGARADSAAPFRYSDAPKGDR
jgi:putative spermidine/putrescine transport system permease protein